MGFYDLSKSEREFKVSFIYQALETDLLSNQHTAFLSFYANEDTYIRKAAYIQTGRLYSISESHKANLLDRLYDFLEHPDFKVRQTAVNAAGEIGMKDFDPIQSLMNTALFDHHHAVRNAVIGSVKKMGQKNPKPILHWANQYLEYPDKEIRREICHGIELRGRTHPQDILPLLQQLEWDKTARVKNTLVHVLGQIAYKKGCLETVLSHLENWKNKELVAKAKLEIIDVHDRYKNFAFYSQEQAIKIINKPSII
jgi:hypothetical protein